MPEIANPAHRLAAYLGADESIGPMVLQNQAYGTRRSAKLRGLPALIEVYMGIVDTVLRKHGFNAELCEFTLVNRQENALFCAPLEYLSELTRGRSNHKFIEAGDGNAEGTWIHPPGGGRPGAGGAHQHAVAV